MRHVRPLPVWGGGPWYLKCAALAVGALVVGTSCLAQSSSTQSPQTTAPSSAAALQDVTKNPALMAEFGKLGGRFQREVTLPSPRQQSDILPVLPDATTFYVALPNYGDAAHQALEIFEQELQTNPVLRDWWQQIEPASQGQKIEGSIEKFYNLSQFMGDEVVISGATGGSGPKVLVVAQIRKPGLKGVLEQMLRALPPSTNADVRIVDPQELANLTTVPKNGFVVLVRPELVVGSSDLATLRSFNEGLEAGERNFASSPFGQRVAEEYRGGATMVGAADLHTIVGQIPHMTPQAQMLFQQSGFADMKYLTWKQRRANGNSFGEGELSFTGPRHGIASWLAAPGPIGGLNFASPSAMLVTSVRLKNPAEMFDDVRTIATAANPNAFAALSAFEQMLGVSLRDDLLGQLSGEITIELDGVAPKPAWKAILGVKDAVRLQQSLNKVFTATHVVAGEAEEGGITYRTVAVPSGRTATELTYAFAPGYMVLSSSHDSVREAIELDRSGGSLGKSAKFEAALPAGHPSGVSALMYEDPIAMAALQMQHAAPGMTSSLLSLAGNGKPSVACAYGEPASIRTSSTSVGLDAGGALIVAAVAIPNLIRSKMAANDATAVGTIRGVVTAEMTYASTYPYRGYAPDLATLGRNPDGPSYTADHAALLDATIANPTCTAGAWCTKAGFRFTINATCNGQNCSDFAVVGTPVTANSGTRSFCAGSDGIIHVKAGEPLATPVSAAECHAWPPIQ
jgi:type IV pilus assembly protein PilA